MQAKPIGWVGSSRKDLKRFPAAVQDDVGYALWLAQTGQKATHAKPLKGFRSADVIEILAENSCDAYRAVYTVRFEEILFVRHVFQKKSMSGIATPQPDMLLIEGRLKRAREEYEKWLGKRR
jgi:phage-related protein